jgi:spore maturation protein CgeB
MFAAVVPYRLARLAEKYRIYSRNLRTSLTKILYLNLGCVIYARKLFYINKSGYTGNFLNIVLKA